MEWLAIPPWIVQWTGLLGITAMLAFAVLLSNNRSAINWRLVISGLALQFFLALFILKFPMGQQLFAFLGSAVKQLLAFSDAGGDFVFGAIVSQRQTMQQLFGPGGDFIFAFRVIPTIIFISALASIAYHLGIMQRCVQGIAWFIYRAMGASGAEALSNAASAFVGQVEAQLLIKPYVHSLTQSELLAVMSGSMACISGGVMAVYIGLGIPAEYLLAASVMAIPGALVVSKIVYPETQTSLTRGDVQVNIEKTTVNIIDAAAHGATEGLKIGLGVIGMLIAFIALIAMGDYAIGQLGSLLAQSFYSPGEPALFWGMDLTRLTLGTLFGQLFQPIAWLLGVPANDAQTIGSLMGTKMVVNEFIAYTQLAPMIQNVVLDPKSLTIASFALCGFANFSSVAIQLGGIGEMAPNRKHDLARLGIKALLCGTLTSYISSAMAGLLFEPNQSTQVTFSGESFLATVVLMVLAAGVIVVLNQKAWRKPKTAI